MAHSFQLCGSVLFGDRIFVRDQIEIANDIPFLSELSPLSRHLLPGRALSGGSLFRKACQYHPKGLNRFLFRPALAKV